MGFIYLVKNKVNQKCYVGQTIRNVEKRWKEHCKSDDNIPFHNAIKKYSPDMFDVTVLVEINDDKLDELETKFIVIYDSLYPNGYNIQTGGSIGKKHCKESCEKMRIAKLGDKNPNFNKPRDEDTKRKISESKSGEKHHFYGLTLTYEHKLKLSESHKTTKLPMYMVFLKERPHAYQSEGYAITNHPNGKNKYFTSKKISLEEKYDRAISYLNQLNSL